MLLVCHHAWVLLLLLREAIAACKEPRGGGDGWPLLMVSLMMLAVVVELLLERRGGLLHVMTLLVVVVVAQGHQLLLQRGRGAVMVEGPAAAGAELRVRHEGLEDRESRVPLPRLLEGHDRCVGTRSCVTQEERSCELRVVLMSLIREQ